MHTNLDTRAPRSACTSSMSHPPKTAMTERHWQPTADEVQRQVQLAGAALLDALNREQVITALIGQIACDEHSLAYRKACRKHTNYDDQVEAARRAIALTSEWLKLAGSAPLVGGRVTRNALARRRTGEQTGGARGAASPGAA